jgi:putative PIN family toxin of toxin-antitoxin system
MKVVFDTNIWMAAIRSRRGASFALLSQIGDAKFHYGISIALWLEYELKLLQSVEEKSTPLSIKQVNSILSGLAQFAEPVPIYFRLRPNLRDEGDNLVFECAAHFGADYIVTHNARDFRVNEIRGYQLHPISPGEFLQLLRKEDY